MEYMIKQIKDQAHGWTLERLYDALEEDFFPPLSWLRRLEALLPQDPAGAQGVPLAKVAFGGRGLKPVISFLTELHKLLESEASVEQPAIRAKIILLVNPWATALKQLVENTKKLHDRSKYDPDGLAQLRDLLQREGRRLGVCCYLDARVDTRLTMRPVGSS